MAQLLKFFIFATFHRWLLILSSQKQQRAATMSIKRIESNKENDTSGRACIRFLSTYHILLRWRNAIHTRAHTYMCEYEVGWKDVKYKK